MVVDFEKEMTRIADTIGHGYTLEPETIPITAEFLEEIHRDYGPGSAHRRIFHDAPHSIGSARRNVRLINIFWPYMEPAHQEGIFDLGMLIGTGHDLEQLLGPGANEQASAYRSIEKVEAADGTLNTPIFKGRLALGNLATTAENQDGKIVQVNLLRGSRDPIKIIAAYGDIGGIPMEGPERLWEDGTSLYYEQTEVAGEEPTVEGLYDFLTTGQTAFMRDQLNDRQIMAAIARYFPGRADEVYRDAWELFHDNIDSAASLAEALGERPDLQDSIAEIVKNFDRSVIGRKIGEMIHQEIVLGS